MSVRLSVGAGVGKAVSRLMRGSREATVEQERIELNRSLPMKGWM
jgi:hypothetical protein